MKQIWNVLTEKRLSEAWKGLDRKNEERERREERERGGGGLGAINWFSLLFKKKVLIFVSRRERDE